MRRRPVGQGQFGQCADGDVGSLQGLDPSDEQHQRRFLGQTEPCARFTFVAGRKDIVVDPRRRGAQSLRAGAVVVEEVVELVRRRCDHAVGAGHHLLLGQRAHQARRRLVGTSGQVLDAAQRVE